MGMLLVWEQGDDHGNGEMVTGTGGMITEQGDDHGNGAMISGRGR